MRATSIDTQIEDAVRRTLGAHRRVVLAVSGGADSMALLRAAGRSALADVRVVVATFDHGSGAAARRAVRLVRREATRLGFLVREGRATAIKRREAAWRDARWSFLRSIAAEEDAAVFTAHTQDDHLETLVMRILRSSGARGLAGLLATSPVQRPLLGFSRAEVREYVLRIGAPFVEDPANDDLSHFRNRVRAGLLPALLTVRPTLRRELLDLAERAAETRRELEAVADSMAEKSQAGLAIPVAALSGMDSSSLAVLWPAFLSRVGAVADRRGIERLARESDRLGVGRSIPVTGGFELVRGRSQFLIRPRPSIGVSSEPLDPRAVTQLGHWRIYPLDVTTISARDVTSDLWQAALVDGLSYEVRVWRAGDRMRARDGGVPRRVARFFEDAGVSGAERKGWPVVSVADEVIWIPGIRRSHAVTARPGGPYVVYRCERDYSRSET